MELVVLSGLRCWCTVLEGMSSVLSAFCRAAFGLPPISSPLGLV